MYTQVRYPNYDIDIDAGWCLDYTERVFGIDSNAMPTAWSAWELAKRKHKDRNFPEGMSVPIFFYWMGDIGDGMFEYGHAAVRDKSGRIYSSPLTGHGYAWFNSIEDLERAFGGGMEYVGWTEDLSGYDVIRKENPMTKEDIKWAIYGIGGYTPTDTEVNQWDKNLAGADVKSQYQSLLSYWANKGEGYAKYRQRMEKKVKELESQTDFREAGSVDNVTIFKRK